MTKEAYAELVKLIGEENAKQFADQVDQTNREIGAKNMILRAQAAILPAPTAKVEPAPAAPVTPASDPSTSLRVPAPQAPVAREFVLDDAAIDEIVKRLSAGGKFTALTDQLGALKMSVDAVTAQVTQVAAAQMREAKAHDDRLKLLERTDEEKQRAWKQDLPEPSAPTATYRPRNAHAPKVEPTAPVAPAERGKPLY